MADGEKKLITEKSFLTETKADGAIKKDTICFLVADICVMAKSG